MTWVDGKTVGTITESQITIGYERNPDGSSPAWGQPYRLRFTFFMGRGPRPAKVWFVLPAGTQALGGATGTIPAFDDVVVVDTGQTITGILSVATNASMARQVTLSARAEVQELTVTVTQVATVTLPLQVGARPGGTLVFQTMVPMPGNGPPVGQIWSQSLSSGARRKLLAADNFDVQYSSPDVWEPGRRLACIDGTGPMFSRTGLTAAPSDGSGSPRRLYSGPKSIFRPRWSPDGNRLLLTSNSARGGYVLCTVDASTGGLAEVTAGNSVKYGTWLRGGLVACLETSNVGTAAHPEIVDGATLVVMDDQFTREVLRYRMDPAWRRDHLSSSLKHDFVVYSAGLRGGDPKNATGSTIRIFDLGTRVEQDLGEGAMPSFSPDGLWIVYSKRSVSTSGIISNRLWVMDIRGSQAQPISPIGVQDQEVAWTST